MAIAQPAWRSQWTHTNRSARKNSLENKGKANQEAGRGPTASRILAPTPGRHAIRCNVLLPSKCYWKIACWHVGSLEAAILLLPYGYPFGWCVSFEMGIYLLYGVLKPQPIDIGGWIFGSVLVGKQDIVV